MAKFWQKFGNDTVTIQDTSFRQKCLKLRYEAFHIYWQTGLQDRQYHAPCTLSKTSSCWLDLCFHDKDLAHFLVKQARDHLWLNKTLPNIWKIFSMCSILFYQNLVKSLPNFCQIFNKNLNQQLLQWYNEQIQFWHILTEWSILGKTRSKTRLYRVRENWNNIFHRPRTPRLRIIIHVKSINLPSQIDQKITYIFDNFCLSY